MCVFGGVVGQAVVKLSGGAKAVLRAFPREFSDAQGGAWSALLSDRMVWLAQTTLIGTWGNCFM